MKNKLIIAGPCAVESENQIISCALELKKRNINSIRTSIWKPRTKPSFSGIGFSGIKWIAELTKLGFVAAIEALLPEHISQLAEVISKENGNLSNLIIWLGSRNQNHLIQQEIAKKIVSELPNDVKLVIKNQPWKEEEHWLGIIDHAMMSGLDKNRIVLCHRGFSPNGSLNPDKYRNLPDFDFAIKIKEKTGLKMLLDPSHIGGSVENVFKIVNNAAKYNFDGLMIEVHPNPNDAQTDKIQQLSLQELDRLLLNFE